MKNKDSLGDRMKGYYEDRARISLPRRINTIIRIDGKAFHSYTKGCQRPFDLELMEDMDQTAIALCSQIQGAKMAYVQSDEISVVLTDYDDISTQAWFDGNIQKMTSIAASIATAKFNTLRVARMLHLDPTDSGFTYDNEYMRVDVIRISNVLMKPTAYFDARVIPIPEIAEVHNYMVWRQQDATRNSIQMLGQAHFSHKQLEGVNCNAIQEKLMTEKGINWNDCPVGFKRGRVVVKKVFPVKDMVQPNSQSTDLVYRSKWVIEEPPIFTQDPEYVKNHVQRIWRAE